MVPRLIDLPWLAPAPADFSAKVRALPQADGPVGPLLQHLANFSLSGAQAASLGRALARLRALGRDLQPLTPFRLGLLTGATAELIAEGLPAAAIRHGVDLTVHTAAYDQVMQEALDPASSTNRARLDAVLLAVDHRWLGLDRPCLHPGEEEAALRDALGRVGSVVEALHTHGGAPAILQTLAAPPLSLFGSYDRRVAGSLRSLIDRANGDIVELAERTGCLLLDVAHLAERIGLDTWFDPIQWHAHKLPFTPEALNVYADTLGRLIGAVRGKARKCLVLDLDNTLWGGVIGDDGLDGIQIGQGAAVGEAFLAVQRTALELRSRGVILAVSSKNDEATALNPFRDHPDMLLRETDLAVFQANWQDKASNLEAIAKALNIGLESLVLLDDNPAERAAVRAALPMVGVPELPADPSWYPWTLMSAGYFEAIGFSEEDSSRARSYQADARRIEVQATAHDPEAYLSALEMTLQMTPFDGLSRSRIAQLVNKTNQFNLTTRRYSESQVADFEHSLYTLQVRLADRFGDFGMIAVAICRQAAQPRTWEIDTWLMSCRVLGRKVEAAMLTRIVSDARSQGVERLIGVFRPTAKNQMVRDHYEKLGFALESEIADGSLCFALDLRDVVAVDLPFILSA